jgi:hypothetical protein
MSFGMRRLKSPENPYSASVQAIPLSIARPQSSQVALISLNSLSLTVLWAKQQEHGGAIFAASQVQAT